MPNFNNSGRLCVTSVINECLIRAIALYLAQNSGRRYETLFSDEADGPLDPERKRMFMAMKREVLRIGDYAQEYFVSQTPELTAMADAVTDLDAMVLARTELEIDVNECCEWLAEAAQMPLVELHLAGYLR